MSGDGRPGREADRLADSIAGALNGQEFASQWVADIRALGAELDRLRSLHAGREFVIHVCPACGFYDADPILRRMPGSRHGPMRCFECGKRAEAAIVMSRIAPSARAGHRQKARDSAPLMEPLRVVEASHGR